MIPEELAKWIIGILAANFLGMIFLGFRITRFMARMEFKVDMMWDEYTGSVKDKSRLLQGIE